MFRTLTLVLFALALACFVASPVLAAADETHEGTFVKSDGATLTMKTLDNKEATVPMAADAKVTCDGKDCKVTDLKAGFKVKVTLNTDKKASKVEASTK
jgi:hypothetical protein